MTKDTLKFFKVQVQRDKSSQPIIHENAVNAFQKGDFYCILCKKDDKYYVCKYPISTIFRITEDY